MCRMSLTTSVRRVPRGGPSNIAPPLPLETVNCFRLLLCFPDPKQKVPRPPNSESEWSSDISLAARCWDEHDVFMTRPCRTIGPLIGQLVSFSQMRGGY
ncbi:hypothetical protein BC567DRAFT_228499 [Phyllosticta citribraziliensis]